MIQVTVQTDQHITNQVNAALLMVTILMSLMP
jgi:hypothetical protein